MPGVQVVKVRGKGQANKRAKSKDADRLHRWLGVRQPVNYLSN